MKKHDKNSGFKLGETYLARLGNFDFYQSTGLSTLKQSLMNQVSGVSTENNPVQKPSSAAILDLSVVSPSLQTETSVISNRFPPLESLDSQKIMISMSGPHGTDIIGAVLDGLARYDVKIEDIMLSRLHHNVTCAALVRINTDNVQMYKDLARGARKWEAELKFDVYDLKDQ